MPKTLKKILRSRGLLIAAGVFFFYLLFSYFAVDPLARRLVPWVAEKELASRASVEKVRFDPFRLTLTVNNLKLTRADGAPLAGFERLYIDFETSTLFRLAWRFKEIRLTAPQGVLDVGPDGKLNWNELLARLQKEDNKKPSDTIPRVRIDHILIERGNLVYSERDRPTPFKAVLAPLGLELDGLSTLTEDRGKYQIAAKLPQQGGTLKWKGNISLNPIASSGTAELQGLKLAELMRIVPPRKLPLQIRAGELHSIFTYDFRMTRGPKEPLPEAALQDLAISLNDVKANLGTNEGGDLSSARMTLKLPTLNFSMQHGAQVSGRAMELGIENVALQFGGAPLFKLTSAHAKGISFDSAENKLQVTEVLLAGGAVQAGRGADGVLDWQRLLGSTASSSQDKPAAAKTAGKPLSLVVDAVRLSHWQADYRDATFKHPLSLSARDLNLGFTLAGTGADLKARQIESRIGPLTLKSAASEQAVAGLESISLQGGEFSSADNSLKIAAVILSGLQTKVMREANRPLNWQDVLAPGAVPAKAAPAPAREKSGSGSLKLALDRLALENAALRFEDKSGARPVVLEVQNAALEIRDYSLDAARSLPIKAQFKIKQGGQFNADGKLALNPLKADLKFGLKNLSLKPFSPYVNQFALLTLDHGSASVNGTLALKQGKTLGAQFTGGFSIDGLAINEEGSNAAFLGWKSLGSNSVKFGWAPNRLHIDELRAVDPVGKIIIHEDKSVNIQRILRTSSTTPGKAPSPPSAKADDTSGFPVVVERVRIDNGELDFADLSLTPQFGTHINTLSGVINGLSTRADTTAQVELDGKVEEYGSARIRGSIQPFRASDFTDLKLAFQNLEMNRLTPYSGKFAGRKIESGKMSVNLEYNIKNRQLFGQNKFVINKLKLGEHVDSPDAVNLPLDLAIALLEDSNGVMDLDLPISGSLDDPQFSYGTIIWKAIVNVIGKIVTAPFRALGKLLGVDSDKLEAVVFDPGSADLAPPEQEKLKTIAQAMVKRPGLALTIVPGYDQVLDKKALQQYTIRRDVMQEMGIKLQPGEKPGPIDLHNSKVQSVILKLAWDRSPEAKNRSIFDKLKNLLDTSKPSDPAAYQSMLQQLEQWVPVTDKELLALADARAGAMRDALAQTAGMNANRIAVGAAVQVTGGAQGVALKMTLDRSSVTSSSKK